MTIDDYDKLAAPIEGDGLRLVPMAPAHEDALLEALVEPELWRWMLIPPIVDRAGVRRFMDDALAQAQARTQVPWVIEMADGSLGGTTRYLDIRWHDRGLEIGWTMMFERARGGWANSRAKALLIGRAFACGAGRVQLKTDARNERSRAAIAAIGATFEGVLHSYQLRADGTLRDTAMFSITSAQWPDVRRRLEARAQARKGDPR